MYIYVYICMYMYWVTPYLCAEHILPCLARRGERANGLCGAKQHRIVFVGGDSL